MHNDSSQRNSPGNPRSPRSNVEKLIDDQAASDSLRRHIGAELKRRNACGRLDADDIFQEMFTRGLNLGREGARGNVLNWLKRIATNYIQDELRKGKSRRGRNVEIEPGHESSVLMENTKEVAEILEVASGNLEPGERRFLQLCLQGLSAEALASASGIQSAKAARDAKYRIYRRLRPVLVALGAG